VSRKSPTFLLSTSSPNVNWFSRFFHRYILWTNSNEAFIKYPITPQLCCYTTMWNINVRKTNNAACMLVNENSDTVFDPSFWISGALNDVFVSNLPALVYPQWSRSLQYMPASVCRLYAFGHASSF